MSDSNYHDRGVKAAIRFLEFKGYDIIDTDYVTWNSDRIDIVAFDDDVLVFIDVYVTNGNDFPKNVTLTDDLKRGKESRAIDYLESHKDLPVDRNIRFDDIDLVVFDTDRAIIRHHINCMA